MTLPPLAKRIFEEHRRIIVPLAVLLGIDLILLALVLFPLASRVGAAEARAAGASARVADARAQERLAKNTLAGKTRAAEELKRFYAEVLPADGSEARRITYLRLAEIASEANLRPDQRAFSLEQERDSNLVRIDLRMRLEGDYPDIRRFIHALETAPEFVVIRDVTLTQKDEPSAPLGVTFELSTYYQARHGT
ncbi:MAG: hypothetical protein GEU99_09550 [Luteitalea sp.]|nr:hypothetical protein [Luteitalea sp.]